MREQTNRVIERIKIEASSANIIGSPNIASGNYYYYSSSTNLPNYNSSSMKNNPSIVTNLSLPYHNAPSNTYNNTDTYNNTGTYNNTDIYNKTPTSFNPNLPNNPTPSST